MKLKLTVFLATFVVTMGLLLGASTAQETDVITDDGDVIRIENLPVIDENTGEITYYNVDFVYDTAVNVYGSIFDFDFPDDETIFLALEAVTDALNLENPVPLGAGPQGSNQFFIGNTLESRIVVAVGGEIFAGVWDQCNKEGANKGCLAGVTAMRDNSYFTWADFTEAQ
jgi:hypothetical protein